MADDKQIATLPVASSNTVDAELQAALARVAAVPSGATMLDAISSEDWAAGVGDEAIESGSAASSADELDGVDAHEKFIA